MGKNFKDREILWIDDSLPSKRFNDYAKLHSITLRHLTTYEEVKNYTKEHGLPAIVSVGLSDKTTNSISEEGMVTSNSSNNSEGLKITKFLISEMIRIDDYYRGCPIYMRFHTRNREMKKLYIDYLGELCKRNAFQMLPDKKRLGQFYESMNF